MSIDIQSFLGAVERILERQVKDSFPRYWDENSITLNILKEFETVLNTVRINGFKRRMQIDWKAFKLARPAESKFGDVAFLVSINYQDGDRIEGAAFLEAKKRERDRTRFGAMRTGQFKRIRKHAPSSMALLYDYEDITQFANTQGFAQGWNGLVLKPCTCSVVVPLNTILSVKKRNTALYKFSIPFSYQLFFRYFQGFDLEFGEQPRKIAKGYATKLGAPTYLVTVSVAYGKTEPLRDTSFNREIFKNMNETQYR
jgi:hypothetical protein